jgi:hypothetical protein
MKVTLKLKKKYDTEKKINEVLGEIAYAIDNIEDNIEDWRISDGKKN